MTGLHPHQVGIQKWTGLLNQRCATLFELLKPAGYATCAVGRLDMTTAEVWHDPANIAHHVDRIFGSTGHAGPGNYFKDVRHTAFYRDTAPYSIPDGGYKTDLITDFAVEFIRSAAQKGTQPFFLYVAHYAPHWPLHAKPADIAKYRELYRKLGWDQARQDRLQRLIAQGLLPAGTRMAPRDRRAPAWEEAEFKDWEAERMATFAAQIDCLDQNVGRLLDALRGSGAERNTLVFFLSDNGASDQAVGALDTPKQTWRSDGTRTNVGNKPSIQPGPAENFVTAGPAWSCLSNSPWRDHKSCNYEGGIAAPLIVWWPGVISRPGSVSHELAHITDVTATCLDVAGVTYPARFADREVLPLAGRSLEPVLRGGQRPGHAVLCWNTSGARAVRMGPWKLVAARGGAWELYDLSVDRAETNNLAGQHPQRVQEMAQAYEQWRAQ